jgi:putative sterol carrier protein
MMKGIPKLGEGIGVLSPKDVISPIKDSTPAILDKVKEYGIEKFVSEVPEIADKFPDLIGAMDEMVKGIDADKWTEYGKEFKDLVIGLFPVINEGIPAVRKANKDVDDVFNKIKGAKVTLGINLIEMGWGFKAKFDGGKITLEEGLEDTDLTLLLPSASQLEMIDVAMTGNMSAAMKAFTTGKVKIKGAMMKGAGLMPLFSAIGKLTKK